MPDAYMSANVESRTVRGLLIPFGELSAPSANGIEPVMFSAATDLELPTDPSIVTLNEDHDQLEPRGRAVALERTDAGIEAEFAIARTPEGDALLARANNPDKTKRPRLSAELRGLVRHGADAVKASLRGAAAVPQGAFASAALFSALDPVEEILDVVEDEGFIDRIAKAVKAALTEGEAPPEDEEKKEEDMTAGAAVVPEGLTPPADTITPTSADGLFAAIAHARKSGDATSLEAYKSGDAMFAIQSIQHAGPTTLTIGADIQEPAFIGQLWSRRAYARKFWDLFSTGSLTSFKINGWKFTEGKEPTVAAYAGNNAEIPSNAVDTEPVTADARRIAGGHRIDRRFTDFSDQGFWDAYFSAMVESYARVSDLDALAGAVTAAATVTPGAVPSGIAKGLAAIVDGALAVIAQENTPSSAVVSPELWRDIVLTGKNEVLGYLSASFGLEEGSTSGFRIIPGPVGTGKVLTIAKEARTMYELPGSPIRVEGLVPANGAVDPALYGYIADVTHNTKALALVTVA